jgi:nitroreductase/NAD-dependent dihydropyrimidine dehydrogenase PreA subunit
MEVFMSWVSIDKETCTGCGICVTRCMRCFTQEGEDVTAYADPDNCNLCGHCIALCPTKSIVHSELDMDKFVDIREDIRLDRENFIRFVKRRRSHRQFEEKPVPREDLETLIDLCACAPTGSNRQTVEIVVVQSQERIARLSTLTVDFFQDMIREIEDRADRLREEGKPIPEDLQQMLDTLAFRRRLIQAREAGLDPIFHKAPAVMIFHSQMQPSTPKDDCIIAAQTVTLAAMTMGLESCYIGLFERAANNYPPLKQELGLPPGHQVFSVLIMGYPKLKFLRSVDRNPIKVKWE